MLQDIFLFCLLFEISQNLQFSLGDCPIFYEEPCSSNIIKFIFVSPTKNVTEGLILDPFQITLPDDFDSEKPLKILIHGYGGLSIDSSIKSVRNAYHEIGYNVIMVDWGPLSEIPCYPTAYFNTWHVGQCVAILAVSLIPFGINPQTLHLVGFSLGAHIAGFTGSNIQKALNVLPERITGLDPALPFFATWNNDWKLDISDASFVDVIHTNAGAFGKIEALGHVDFYLNGGSLQPACYNAPYPPLCSHIMSGIYFAESIFNERIFVGIQCDNIANYILGFCQKGAKAIMGEFIDKRVRGSFYIETANSTPFALDYAFDNLLFF